MGGGGVKKRTGVPFENVKVKWLSITKMHIHCIAESIT